MPTLILHLQEKLARLFKAAIEKSEKQNDYYMQILFDQYRNVIQVKIIDRATADELESRNIFIDDDLESEIDNAIEFIKNFKVSYIDCEVQQ